MKSGAIMLNQLKAAARKGLIGASFCPVSIDPESPSDE
jgi:hypothetical protein